MPALFNLLRLHRSALLRATTASGVLAGALSTLAGVSELSLDRDAVPVAAARGAVWTTSLSTSATSRADTAAKQPAVAQGAWHSGLHAAPRAEPPPFAPGGDDLLPSSEDFSVPLQASRVRRAGQEDGPPTVSVQTGAPRLWLERGTVGLGQTAVLHLSAADAASHCKGVGALEGVAITGPRINVRVTTAGPHRLTVMCAGSGGAALSEVRLTVPLPVALSSRENQDLLAAQGAVLPDLKQLGLRPTTAAAGRERDLMAAGDFLQQGRLSIFVIAATAEGTAAAHLMARDGAGRWIDRSAELLEDAERGVCAWATQAIASDFNRDGRPDVWIACDGRQLLFLSQADGRYGRIETPFELRALQVEARDVDGDGWPDIVTLDHSLGAARTLLLLGRGDGRFEAGPAEAWRLSLPLSGSSR
jgi:hypothetical protein